MITIDYIVGDSIAAGTAINGFGLKTRSGKFAVKSVDDKGISEVGASPTKILGFLNEIGAAKFKGKNVIISTGLSNGPNDLKSEPNDKSKSVIRKELQFLKDAGAAKVFMIGVSNEPPEKFPGLKTGNADLKLLADEFGYTFFGGFKPSADGIHPNYGAYYKSNIKPVLEKESSITPTESNTTTATPVSAVSPAPQSSTQSVAQSNTGKIPIIVNLPQGNFKSKTDLPDIVLYIGSVAKREDQFNFVDTEEVADDQYTEVEFAGQEEELLEVMLFKTEAQADIPQDTNASTFKVEEGKIDYNDSSFTGPEWKSFSIEKAVAGISKTKYKASKQFEESLKKVLYFIKQDAEIKDLREAAYLLGTAFAESSYSLQRWESDYACKSIGIKYGPSGPCSAALNYYRDTKNGKKKNYYELGTDSKGFPYFGRGLIQLTGKANYEKYGKKIGVDLVADGDLAIEPENSYKIASIYLRGRTFKYVLSGDLTYARKSVNGGDLGLEEVNGAYNEWLRILKESALAA